MAVQGSRAVKERLHLVRCHGDVTARLTLEMDYNDNNSSWVQPPILTISSNKLGDRRQIRRSQMFIKLAFEFGCDVILMSHPITRSLGNKLRQTSIFAMKYSFFTNQTDAVW